MNPLTNVKNITKLNETELATGSIHKKSWHDMYKDSAWVFIGGLEYGLTEGDVIAVFSQYGEIENINLVRDKKTGKSKGYSFLCYSNQKSTVLAVDNLNGIKLCNRTIRVDHVANYKPPKENERDDEVTKVLKSEGCAPQVVQKFKAKETSEVQNDGTSENRKKSKKEKKKKKRKHKSVSSDSDKDTHNTGGVKVKKEKHDPGYDKYDKLPHKIHNTSKKLHEKRMDFPNGEASCSNENDRSKISKNHFKVKNDDEINRLKTKIKTEPDSDRKYNRTDRNNVMHKDKLKINSETEYRSRNVQISSKKHKRKRSSSSDDDDDQASEESKHNKKMSEHKNSVESEKYFKHKRKSNKRKDTSSDDSASSTQTSSEDEDKQDDRYSGKDKHVTFSENRSNQNDLIRDKNYPRTGDLYKSRKSKHYDKADEEIEVKSRTKYQEDDRNYLNYKDPHYYKKKSNKS